jgi:acyl dehydratase
VRRLGLAELRAMAPGTELGTSGWRDVDQARIDRFADATDDHQWIHVDRERAAAGPFGGTIAHGFLTLSLVPALVGEVVAVECSMAVNYGLNRVRFPAPVPSASRLRAVVTLASAADVEGGVQAVYGVEVRRDGGAKPVCVAEQVVRYYR